MRSVGMEPLCTFIYSGEKIQYTAMMGSDFENVVSIFVLVASGLQEAIIPLLVSSVLSS